MRFGFNGFVVDSERRTLTRDGEPVPIEPKAFDLLVFLLQHRNRAVLKDELIDGVWQGKAVSDAALTTGIRSVRKAIDTDGKPSRVINLPRVGYRFDGEVREFGKPALSTEMPPEPASHADEGGESATRQRAVKPSIAVLPFDNMSPDPDQDYFADGITEDIITELSRFSELSVIARNSSFAFRGHSVTMADLAERLGARYVLEGSVRSAGGRIRVTAQLIDSQEDAHLWAERFDRALEDVFDVQDELTHAIVTALVPHVGKSERDRVTRKPPDSLDAWECYQRGLSLLYQYNLANLAPARELFERAIKLDSEFSDAYAGFSYMLCMQTVLKPSAENSELLARASEAAQRAVQIDDQSPIAWISAARCQMLCGNTAEAIASAYTATALNPNLAFAHFILGHCMMHAGRASEAVIAYGRALELSPADPLQWLARAGTACSFVMLGRFEEAVKWAGNARRQIHANLFPYLVEISALGHLGRQNDAQAVLDAAREKFDDVSVGYFDRAYPIADPEARETVLHGLRAAGLTTTV
jgi:TolB-like protein